MSFYYAKLNIVEVDIMRDLIEFLTSQEIMIVYAIAFGLCIFCVISYIVKINSSKYRMKNNTRELNKLVGEIKEKTSEEEAGYLSDKEDSFQEPVLENVTTNNDNSVDEASSVIELLESTAELQSTVNNQNNSQEVESIEDLEPIIIEPIVSLENSVNTVDTNKIETNKVEESELVSNEGETEFISQEKEEKQEEVLQYTSVEPSPEDARRELDRLKEELTLQQAQEDEMENIALNNYEEEQEANAIISLEELVKKSKDMYEANELTQYADEGNEPISLQDLERKLDKKASELEDTFVLENVVPESELLEAEEESNEAVIVSSEAIKTNTVNTVSTREMPEISSERKFKSSPIISPIYGIEKKDTDMSPTELELENTANYDKLDEEIKKTNEFLMTLRELQKKLD